MRLSRFKTPISIVLVALLAWLSVAPIARAEGLGVLRDTEIEEDLRSLVTPIWQAAGLDPRR